MAKFSLYRDDLLSQDEMQRIHETALDILHEVGLAVLRDDLREVAQSAGFRVREDRIFFEPQVVAEYLDERRRRAAENAPLPREDDYKLYIGASQYCHHVHDIKSDKVVPFNTELLIEVTKFVDTLAERGVASSPPGCPLDVPPELQRLAQFRIGAENLRGGSWRPMTDSPPQMVEFIFAMAEVMGRPIRQLPVHLVSPLRLAGQSLDIALHFRERIDCIHIGNMPAAGATAPILPFGALAQSAAEVLGSFVVLSTATDTPIDFQMRVLPFDLRATAMVMGTPETLLYDLAIWEMNDFYGYQRHQDRGSGRINTMASFPGSQAAAERASLMAVGALLGARGFGGGVLRLDEVFSPEQLLIDCEIKDHVQRLLEGLTVEEGTYNWVDMVRKGSERDFLSLDSTLDNYQQSYWYSRLFERTLPGWRDADPDSLHKRALELYREGLARYDYELDPHRRNELDNIWEQAVRSLA